MLFYERTGLEELRWKKEWEIKKERKHLRKKRGRDACELAVYYTARRYNLVAEYCCMSKSARMSLKTKWGLDGAQVRNAQPHMGASPQLTCLSDWVRG